MQDLRHIAIYLRKYKELSSPYMERGCGGCNLLQDIGFLSYKVLKWHLTQEIIHFNVFYANTSLFWLP